MSQLPYNDKAITEYLLGALPAAETERFDELSFTDHNFIDELNFAERDLIDAYVNGELDSQLRSRFENHYLTSPVRRERVQLARSFYESALSTIAANQPAQQAGSHISTHRNALLPLSSNTAWRWQWAFVGVAVVGLCLAIVGWVIFERYRRTPPDNQIAQTENTRTAAPAPTPQVSMEAPQEGSSPVAPQAANRNSNEQPPSGSRAKVASVILGPQMRGGTAEPAVTVTPQTDYIVIRLELEPNDYSTYRVSLLTQTGGEVLWRSNKSFPRMKGRDKSLNVRFPATLLEPGSYLLRVWGLSQTGIGEIISDYRFRVVKQ